MKKLLKISIIIPVYNVSKYLKQCVDSVVKQNYKNTEIILVDDGSTDGSCDICDSYSRAYPNIISLHKSNGGLSDARNYGISRATGDYIMFLDGDDFWYDSGALTRIVSRILSTETDVLSFSYRKFYEQSETFENYHHELTSMPLTCKNKFEQLDFLFENSYFIASACNKIVKKSIFDEYMNFEVGAYSEDIEWCAKLLTKATSFDFVAEQFYSYRQRENSISHSINDKKCADLCRHIIQCIQMIDHSEVSVRKHLSIFSAYQFATFFVVQAHAKNEQIELINELEQYAAILKFHNRNKKVFLLRILTILLGYKNTCKLIRMIYTRRRSH